MDSLEFICNICDKKLSSKYKLKVHTIKLHTNRTTNQGNIEDESSEQDSVICEENIYSCPCCSYVDKSEAELDNHLAWKCSNYNQYIEYLKESNHKKSTLSCNTCGYQTKSKILYKKHIKKHGYFKEIQVFACPVLACSYNTSRQSLISTHILTHTKVKKYKCDHCSYSAIRSDYLKKHIVTHKKDYRPYKCNFCDYTTIRNDYLKKHIAKHTQYPSIKCADCDYRCSGAQDLRSHRKIHRQAILFKCTACNFENHDKYEMKMHVATHSEFSAFMCHDNSAGHDCVKCKRTFPNDDDFNSHQCREESDKYSCEQCSYVTDDEKVFRFHLSTHLVSEDSNVTAIPEYDGGIILDEAKNVTMISDFTIVELPDSITFFTDSKITGNDLVISAYPIEDMAVNKEGVSELSTDPGNLILNIEY